MNSARYHIAALTLVIVTAASTDGFAQQPLLSSRSSRRAVRSRHTRPVASRTEIRQTDFDPIGVQPGMIVADDVARFSSNDDDLFLNGPDLAGYHTDHQTCTDSNCVTCGDAGASCCADGWIHAEYLMWWPRPMDIPALVTSGTQASEGVLGQPDTATLVGGQLLNQMYSGARLRLGIWSDPCHGHAWEVDGFFVGEATDRYSYSGTGAAGSGIIARPFFNVQTTVAMPNGGEDAEFISYPDLLSGSVDIEATSQLYGIGIHSMWTLSQSSGCGPSLLNCQVAPTQSRIMGFLGWRYLDLSESLRINENLTSLLQAPDNGQFLIEDRFETDNTFNGVDLGVMWNGAHGRLSLDLLMRMAIGSNHQNVYIDGSTSIRDSSDAGNNVENAVGGILAQRTNIGTYSRDRFAVVPELGVTLGYSLSPQWRATIGYTFLYWSSVVRPGDQIDRDVNPGLFPPESTPLTGLERPTFGFVESDLWVNGLNLGLERTW